STFSFDDMTTDEARKFIRENPYNLPKHDLEKVRNYFGITSREMMSGKNQLRVLKMIEPAAFEYYQKRNRKLERFAQKGRDDALKYRKMNKGFGSPDINAYDLVKPLKEIDNEREGVLITSPILDLVFAHIKAKHKTIDVLAMEDIYAYVFELQKIAMRGGTQKLYDFFSNSLGPRRISNLKGINPKVWAFFDSLLQDKDNVDAFKLKYDKRDSAAISPQYQNAHYKEFYNRVRKAKVRFVKKIPDKFYGIINMGDEVMQSNPEVAKELIGEYMDHLVADGSLIAYFNDEENIPEIFDGKSYKVVDVRTPRVGVKSGGNNNRQDKVVIMQKKYC
ncbi:MAG: hypothetical protein K2I70_05660, partial [Bacilli bacterium]|nr:hypothetical protein [Bacilli bacterium]